MKLSVALLALIYLALTLTFTNSANASGNISSNSQTNSQTNIFHYNPQIRAVAGEFLVQLQPDLSAQAEAEVLSQIQDLGGVVIHRYEIIKGAILVKVQNGKRTEELFSGLTELSFNSKSGVLHAVPNFIRQLALKDGTELHSMDFLKEVPKIPAEVAPPQGWQEDDIDGNFGTSKLHSGMKEVWNKFGFKGDKKTVIAVIDTGIDYTHPDLVANLWRNKGEIPDNGIDDDHNGYVDDVIGYNFMEKNNIPYDDHSHGTHVSGIAAATGGNGIGISGMCPRCSIMALRFLGKNGGGADSDAVSAIEYAIKMKADVINCSWGGAGESPILEAAFKAASDAGILVAVAAGNEGLNLDGYRYLPAVYQFKGKYTVSAIDFQRRRPTWSNFSTRLSQMVFAGHIVTSSVPGNRYDRYSGTSMASPGIAGFLGMLKSTKPNMTADEIYHLFEKNISPAGMGGTVFKGLPNALKIFAQF